MEFKIYDARVRYDTPITNKERSSVDCLAKNFGYVDVVLSRGSDYFGFASRKERDDFATDAANFGFVLSVSLTDNECPSPEEGKRRRMVQMEKYLKTNS